VGVWLLLAALGCAGTPVDSWPALAGDAPEASVAFDAGDYPAVFSAARDALTDLRFTPDRVDAARGVITTLPKRTAGLATPWDREQTTLGDDGRDFMHQHERVCTVVFEPPEAPTTVSVGVTIYRVRRPNWRVESDAIRRSTHAIDPIAHRAGDGPEFREAISADPALAARIASDIAARAGIANTNANADD